MKTTPPTTDPQALQQALTEAQEQIRTLERQAEIEVALERVRARSSAMRHSDELAEIALVVFQQIENLGILAGSCWITLQGDDPDKADIWLTTLGGDAPHPTRLQIPLEGNSQIQKNNEAWKRGERYVSYAFEGEALVEWYNTLHKLTGDPMYKLDLYPDQQQNIEAFLKYGSIGVASNKPPLSEEVVDIMQRFARVFEQTYTRFLDLRRAEEQAREAEIEVALERLRARTMAMHHSSELSECAVVTFQQLQAIGLTSDLTRFMFSIFDEQTDSTTLYMTDMQGGMIDEGYPFPLIGFQPLYDLYRTWQRCEPGARKEEVYTIEYPRDEQQAYLTWLMEETALKDDPAVQFYYHNPEERRDIWIENYAFFRYGVLGLQRPDALPERDIDTFKRFARVFEQTYTRYLDLKQAEEQAREAQIEAALERIRARSMAMHRSDELADCAFVMHEQLQNLGLAPELSRFVFSIIDEGAESSTLWATDMGGGFLEQGYQLPLDEYPTIVDVYRAWQSCEPNERKEKALVVEFSKEEMRDYLEWLITSTGMKEDPSVQYYYSHPEEMEEKWVQHMALFAHGSIDLQRTERLSEQDLETLKRFAAVFEQTYIRFLDLKKAEEQAREAQIEAALERVRASTMAMHKSDELRSVIATVFEQLTALGFDAPACGLIIFEENGDAVNWLAGFGEDIHPVGYHIPYFDHPYYQAWFDTWRSGETWKDFVVEGDLKKSFDEHLFQHTDFKNLPDAGKDAIRKIDRAVSSNAFMKHGMLGVLAMDETISEEEKNILKRFARVFDQTYTRFLDLQNAEQRAREAEIEMALERVRARTMGMHKSDELKEVVSVMYEQLGALGLAEWGCSIMIFDKASNRYESWVAETTNSDLNSYYVEGQEHPVITKLWKLWEQQGPPLKLHHTDEVKRDYDEYWLYETDFRTLPEAVKQSVLNEREIYLNFVSMRHGLLSAYGYEQLPDEKIAIMQRFARVFEQTYTRFLDLKQAEARAREAQIEAALERVRARAMAMHKSDELEEVVVAIFEGLEALGFDPQMCNLNIKTLGNEPGHGKVWTSLYTDTGLTTYSYFIPFLDHPLFHRIWQAFEDGEPYFIYELAGEDRTNLERVVYEAIGEMPEMKQSLDQHNDMVGTIVFMSQGRVDVWRETALTQEEIAVVQRFTSVIDLTYTRFDDLKRAEAQAREAQIEAALERVRARAMAMQHSSEMEEVVGGMFQGLESLGFDPYICTICIIQPDEMIKSWISVESESGISSSSFFVPFFDHPFPNGIKEAFSKGASFFEHELSGESYWQYNQLFFEHVNRQGLEDLDRATKSIDFLIGSCIFMSHGFLAFFRDNALDENEKDILHRFSRVVDLTYTRFDDLQQSEERAREAVKQASLDRVRAEIASMRTTADLERITPLIWRELTTLGVPFYRCGVFIVDEEAEQLQAFLTTPESESLGELRLPFDHTENVKAMVEHWRKGKVFVDRWDQEEFVSQMQLIMRQGLLEATGRFADMEDPPESLTLQFIPFTQGLLYIGGEEALSDDEIDLARTLADAFSVAYARYEDFHQLEVQKQRVEQALTELKATQQQLVQSEKLASLGQLTAGIAHEIKNPLNFVNNFAELVGELVDELGDEVESTHDASGADTTHQFKEILADLRVSAEQIAKHGKRADGIVHAMMQHASGGSGERESVSVNDLLEEYVNLAYHGKRAQVPGFNAEIIKGYDEAVGTLELIPQEMGRVFLNLIGNAFDAVIDEASKQNGDYEPIIRIETRRLEDTIEIRVTDNGSGIPPGIIDKIFEPFYTTKPTGSGTGLGLSLSHDIVTQGHGGTLSVEGTEGEGATFIIRLPA